MVAVSGGLYSMEKKDYNKKLDLTHLKPYGDTMNDGKVQVSFTLPVKDDENGIEAALQLSKKMGLKDPAAVWHEALDTGYTFYVVYGSLIHTVDYTTIHVERIEVDTMDMKEVDAYIEEYIKRQVVIIGASTGTDAHTVGIDAIMNMKGYAGHYGLERYARIDAYNLGSQVPNEELVKKAIELQADAILVSQTVTQKDIHIKNLTELVELLEAEGIREQIQLICGGPRITHELAKELGYDAGFGPGKYADDVASFVVTRMKEKVD